MRLETEIAIRAASIAQEIADSRVGADRVISKGGIDIVTGADVACEDAIRSALLKAFPAYAVIGEEREGTARPGQPYWLVDPICGTRTYASDLPLYCTNIALVEDGEVTVAAVGIGKTKEILFAERGSGARVRSAGSDTPVTVGDTSNALWIDGHTEQAVSVLKTLVLSRRWYVWKFSSSVAYAYMALGRIAAVIQISAGNPAAAPYGSVHAAAGCFIAREAGAILTDLENGHPWTLATRSFLMASTPSLHEELHRIVSAARITAET